MAHSPAASRRRGRSFSLQGLLSLSRPLLAFPARVLDDRVRAGKHQARMTVVETHQVGRLPARSADLDDLTRPVRMKRTFGSRWRPLARATLELVGTVATRNGCG